MIWVKQTRFFSLEFVLNQSRIQRISWSTMFGQTAKRDKNIYRERGPTDWLTDRRRARVWLNGTTDMELMVHDVEDFLRVFTELLFPFSRPSRPLIANPSLHFSSLLSYTANSLVYLSYRTRCQVASSDVRACVHACVRTLSELSCFWLRSDGFQSELTLCLGWMKSESLYLGSSLQRLVNKARSKHERTKTRTEN